MENRKSLFDPAAKSPEESSMLQMKSKLSVILSNALLREHYTAKAAAARLGCGPAKIKQVMDGKLNALTLDFLMTSLFKIGYAPEMTFSPHHPKTPFGLKLKR